jgi:hypothetical protein
MTAQTAIMPVSITISRLLVSVVIGRDAVFRLVDLSLITAEPEKNCDSDVTSNF